MALKVSLLANCLSSSQYGGHLWVYLNWALGFRGLGAEVKWIEPVGPMTRAEVVREQLATLQNRLARYNLESHIALCSWSGEPLPDSMVKGTESFAETLDADLLINLAYDGVSENVIKSFKRSAFIDIDPGLTQIWIAEGQMDASGHDVYFTIGETVGNVGSSIPDCDLHWHYTPPPIALTAWPLVVTDRSAPFTTITNWRGPDVQMQGTLFSNGKRDGFLPFLDVPRSVTQRMQLAVNLDGEPAAEATWLKSLGWEIVDPRSVAVTPWGYQSYVQDSFAEFSCAKPSCMRLQNAWISDRTICYLASGKPAVVQHTGASRFLPDDAGLFRFRDRSEAVHAMEVVAGDYEYQCQLARAFAENFFDARKVLTRLLETAL